MCLNCLVQPQVYLISTSGENSLSRVIGQINIKISDVGSVHVIPEGETVGSKLVCVLGGRYNSLLSRAGLGRINVQIIT